MSSIEYLFHLWNESILKNFNGFAPNFIRFRNRMYYIYPAIRKPLILVRVSSSALNQQQPKHECISH